MGLDTIGVDPIADAYLSIHRRLFQDHDLVVMENLANLDQIGDGLFTLFALPLRYQDADGSPFGRWRSWTGRNEHGTELLYQSKGRDPEHGPSP